jgi:proteasome lid subunit RPN8/RPN11
MRLCALSPSKEICGVIGGDDLIYEFTNIAGNPYSFLFHPKEWVKFKSLGVGIKAVYHSHLNGDTTPSQADLDNIKRLGFRSVIVTNTEVKEIEYEA